MPEFTFNIHDDGAPNVFGSTANQPTPALNDVAMNDSPQPLSDMWGSAKTPVYNDAVNTNMDINTFNAKTEDLQSRPIDQVTPVIDHATEEGSNAVPAAESVENLTQEQEVKLVRSALRSSLDGEDADLLNNFLSRAKAKRAAKAAHPEDAEAAEVSSSMEESPEVGCSTPRSRRALEDLNANSPSPVKLQLSASKYDAKFGTDGAEDQEDIVQKETIEEQVPSSPACRRSTRTKASSAPPVRNTISLRRAKGTEFIFLQRTDAQQMALTTKRNTRLNKGKSVSPIVALEALSQQSSEGEAQPGNDEENSSRSHKSASSRAIHKARKQVSWNEERMAEYEEYREVMDDEEDEEVEEQCKNDVGATPRPRSENKRSAKKATSDQRSSRSQAQKEDQDTDSGATDSGLTAPTTAPASATPRSRRVRRLGDSGAMGLGTPVKTGGRGTSKPPAASAPVADAAAGPSTPTKGRRKLAPKSPRSSKLPALASKSAKSADQSFVSGIPTRSSKSTDDGSMLQVSAGCTPAAKRVRSRS
jgi:hypothetical protein